MAKIAKTIFDSDGDNTAQVIKNGPGVIHYIEASNINAADAFLQLFNAVAADVTVGTTVPKQSFLVGKGDGTNRGAMDRVFNPPLDFQEGMSYACTTTVTGNGDPAVGLVVNIGYE